MSATLTVVVTIGLTTGGTLTSLGSNVVVDPENAVPENNENNNTAQTVETQDDGTMLFRCTVDGLEEVTWWVLSMGHHCTVLEPCELAERVKELARKILDAYEPVSATAPGPRPAGRRNDMQRFATS